MPQYVLPKWYIIVLGYSSIAFNTINPVKTAEEAKSLLKKVRPDHTYEFVRIFLDREENMFSGFIFICVVCNCEFHIYHENIHHIIENCIILNHHSAQDSCEAIVMQKVLVQY